MFPRQAQVDEVVAQWKTRQEVPKYVFDVIRALPRDSHPMVMLSTGILAMQKDSKFAGSLQLGQVQQDERLGIASTRMPATSSPASPSSPPSSTT